jgi:undecaprenyl diphosphate synthase
MGLFIQYLEKEMANMRTEGVHLKVLGDVSRFPPDLQQRIRDAQADPLAQPKITLNVAANYGGRWDIVQAVQAWQQAHPGADAAQLNVDNFGQYLSTAGMPDVDLLIRTGGEFRISNFLLWQAAYAELYFTDTLWPDFDAKELRKSIVWFADRDRRFGKLSSK